MNKSDYTACGIIVLLVVVYCLVNTGLGLFLHNLREGIPITHIGEVIYTSHRYAKWNDYNYTNVEVLTYSGDSHHIYFWEHIDLELGKVYEIHTVLHWERGRMFPYWFVRLEEIVELREIA